MKVAITRSVVLYVVVVGLLASLRFAGVLRKLPTAEIFYGPALCIGSCWMIWMIVATVHRWVEREKPDA